LPGYCSFFGTSVAALGGDAIIGAPGAFRAVLMNVTTGAITRMFDSPNPGTDGFGATVAALAPNVVVGAPADDEADAGAVFLFDAPTGDLVRKFLPPDAGATQEFGSSIAAIGGNLLIGAPGAGASGRAYLFDAATGDLLQTFTPPDPDDSRFGAAVAEFGANALIGAPNDDSVPGLPGAAYLFDTSGALLQTFLPVIPDSLFGMRVGSVAGRVVVGSSSLASLYDPASASWIQFFTGGGGVAAVGSDLVVGDADFDFDSGIARLYAVCGNGTVAGHEHCEDGNYVSGDGCSADCRLELCGAAPRNDCRNTVRPGSGVAARKGVSSRPDVEVGGG
jgi:cysteine-rich repeat protein